MGAAGQGPGHRILVVDDDESSRDLVRRSLRGEHEVLVAEDGERALEILGAEGVDLVLLDVMMPGLPGIEVCRRVKAMDRDAYLPVLLLSALDDQTDRNAGLAAGADDYISKPFDRSELRMRVQTFLRLRDQDRTIRSQIAQTKQLQELKDDLVALIAHDLRNPLLGIQGNLELIQLMAASPEFAPLTPRLEKAIASTEELRDLLDGLLDVRLLEGERITLQVEPVSVRALLEGATAALEGAALAKGVSLRLEADPGLTARLDRKLVRRAVENLLSNAIRHTRAGSAVELRATGHADRIDVGIADRGEGVPEALKRALFQKFSAGADRSPEGRRRYGLGLYLVRLVAEAHGGSVSAADRDGGGSVFVLTLPR